MDVGTGVGTGSGTRAVEVAGAVAGAGAGVKPCNKKPFSAIASAVPNIVNHTVSIIPIAVFSREDHLQRAREFMFQTQHKRIATL